MSKKKKEICMPVTAKVMNSLGMHSVSLLMKEELGVLKAHFQEAPQFSKINLEKALKNKLGTLRLILVGEQDYCLEQCAMYLVSMVEKMNKTIVDENKKLEGNRWTGLDYDEEEAVSGCEMVVLSSDLVDPPAPSSPQESVPKVQLEKLPSTALMVKASPSAVITREVTNEMLYSYPEEAPPHLILSMKAQQMDKQLCQDLQLNHGFVVWQVSAPSQDYYQEVFWSCAEKFYPNLRENAQVQGETVVNYLKKLQGTAFCQRDIESAITRTFHLGKTARELSSQDFCFQPTPLFVEKSAREKLEQMVELTSLKTALSRLLAMDKLRARLQEKGVEPELRHRHLAFVGSPGTGKTVSAQLLAQILQEEGEGSGLFVEAGREDMIGSYVGHTAPKIAKLFEKAKGGVLFLDEIGAIAPDKTGSGDSYAEEAVNTLVYHMDRNPDTIVIFATYPDEMEAFLNSNPGLKSRIAQTILFDSYEKDSLLLMLQKHCEKTGYGIHPKAVEACGNYLENRKRIAEKSFGNGREVRRIFNAAEEEMASRIQDNATATLTLTLKDMSSAITRLELEAGEAPRLIGFAV